MSRPLAGSDLSKFQSYRYLQEQRQQTYKEDLETRGYHDGKLANVVERLELMEKENLLGAAITLK